MSDAARRLCALRVVDRDAWRAEVRAALADTGSTTLAAEQLGVSRRIVWEWAREPDVADGIALRGRGRPKAGG